MASKFTINWSASEISGKNVVATRANRKKYPWLQKIAEDIRDSLSSAMVAGADAMREKILMSPTGSSSNWHINANIERAKRPPHINRWGSRYDTGTMYNSVGATKARIVQNKDRRRQGTVTGSFGWPATSEGQIKDAPSSPIGRPSDGPDWRSDPNYFWMQEFGFNNMGDWVDGMHSQEAGAIAADIKFQAEMRKRGYK